jgi:hypothetical protein
MKSVQLNNYILTLSDDKTLRISTQNTLSSTSVPCRLTSGIEFSTSFNKELFHLTWMGFDGSKFCPSNRIVGLIDPDGTVSDNCAPGKLQFQTSGEDGLMRTRLDIDKHGRVISHVQLWATTQMPAGTPLVVQSHYDETESAPSLLMRRSRGTFIEPTSVKNGDGLFSLVWAGHTGVKYSNAASIEVNVNGSINKTKIPSEMIFKISNNAGLISSMVLNEESIAMNVPVKLPTYEDEDHRDTSIKSPLPGMMIYIKNSDTFQGYRSSKGWVTLSLI